MYIPRKFKAPSDEAVFEFVQKYPFATLVAQGEDSLEAVHIPLTIQKNEEQLELHGHIAKANLLSRSIENNAKVLVIFNEPHAYISSSWYDHINVPTWNYIAIHMKGVLSTVDHNTMIEALKTMVDQYETGRPDRYHLSDMPDDMLEAHLKGLTAFKIEVNDIEANFKLSQNRNDLNYNNIIEKLKTSGSAMDKLIAEEMQKLRS